METTRARVRREAMERLERETDPEIMDEKKDFYVGLLEAIITRLRFGHLQLEGSYRQKAGQFDRQELL
jgi:hypothetical protein